MTRSRPEGPSHDALRVLAIELVSAIESAIAACPALRAHHPQALADEAFAVRLASLEARHAAQRAELSHVSGLTSVLASRPRDVIE